MKRTSFPDLVRIMARLRGPKGCPWDREQTHASLLRYLDEESRELRSAVEAKDWYNLQEELGDVLLQVLFHAQMAKERGAFDIDDVMATLRWKLENRHPHVFGEHRGQRWTAQDVKDRWDELKARERTAKERASSRMKRRMRGRALK